jgi:hypothetical protein
VTDVVNVLLSVHKFVEVGNPVVGQKIVVSRNVQPRASTLRVSYESGRCGCEAIYLRSTDVIWTRRNILVRVISGRRNLITSLTHARLTVLSAVIGILGVVRCSGLMIRVERTSRRTASAGFHLLATVVA